MSTKHTFLFAICAVVALVSWYFLRPSGQEHSGMNGSSIIDGKTFFVSYRDYRIERVILFDRVVEADGTETAKRLNRNLEMNEFAFAPVGGQSLFYEKVIRPNHFQINDTIFDLRNGSVFLVSDVLKPKPLVRQLPISFERRDSPTKYVFAYVTEELRSAATENEELRNFLAQKK